MRRTPPSTITVPFSDSHRIMSPSSLTAANLYDNQCTSLFGDPVPPSPEICFEELDKDLYRTLRGRSDSMQSNSIVDDFPKANSFATPGEKGSGLSNSQRISSSRLSRRESDDQPTIRIFTPTINRLASISPTEDLKYSVGTTLPVGRYLPQNSASNRPQLVVSPPSQDYDPADLWNDNVANKNRRRSSELSEVLSANLGTIRSQQKPENDTKRIFSKEPMRFRRQGSNESFSSGEWFKPSNDYQEWAKIPRLRPSSKNVMSINQESGNHRESPLASLIQGSTTSTSSDEKASPETVKMNNIPDDTPLVIISGDVDEYGEMEESPPKELPPPEAATIPKELPLPIVTNAVTTGSNFRANPPRPQKKPSFTIIAERSPQSSRPTSPSPLNSGRVSPFLGYGFKESPRPTSRRKSSQSSKIQLPNITDPNNNLNTSDDSVRPLVQFNMSSLSGPSAQDPSTKGSLLQRPKVPTRTKKKQKLKQTEKPKGLLKVHSFESLPKITKTSPPKLPSRRLSKTSIELSSGVKNSLSLPSHNPTSKQKGVLRVFSADSSPSENPDTEAANGRKASLKRRNSLSPVRKDQRRDSVSSERRSSSLTMPRSSITSDRRSSNLSTVTTSDFSFRRNSISPPRNTIDPSMLSARSVKSSPRSPRRVAKPTSLSPIIGTPNKDTQLSTEEQLPTGSNSRRSSQSRIPLVEGSNTPSRSNSRVASRNNSRVPSAVNSRAASPSKDFLPVSRPNSRVTSRPTSRSSSRGDTRIPSRIPSRSNSRSSVYERVDPITKKAASLSPPKSRRVSPIPKKSRSESPKKSPRRSASPRKSPSPPRTRSVSRTERRSASMSRSPMLMKSPTPAQEEKIQQPIPQTSRIPSRKDPGVSAKKVSNNLKKPEITVKRSSSVGRTSTVKRGKETSSVGKPSGSEASSLKPSSSFRGGVSSMKRETSNLRRETSNVRKEKEKEKDKGKTNLRKEASDLKKESSDQKKASTTVKPVKKDGTTSKGMASNLPKAASKNIKRETSNVKRETSTVKREASNLKRTSSNAKREASNLKREGSNLKREPSDLKREPSNLKRDSSMKREPSNLKREPSNLKREPSNLNREPSNLKREPSNLKREPSNLKREGSRISLKKSSFNPKMDTGAKATVVKKRSDSNLNKKLEKKGSFRIEKAAATMADESDASTIPVDSLKEDGSADEAKPDKLIPLTKANVISMTTAAITAQPVQITTSITNQIPLTKSNSSNQLLSSSDSSGTKQDMKDMDPVTILEKSQKTLETIQKTVAEATEEIQKTINENLTDLKTLEGDIGRISDDSAAPFEKSDSLTTILENPASKTPTAEVTTTSKTPDGGEAVDSSKSPAPPSHPIEANVSVLTTKKSSENLLHPNTNHNNNNMNNSSSTSSTTNGTHEDTEDMAERVSERAISVLPEVECESANLQSYELHNEEDVQKNSRSDNNNDQGHVIATNIGADSMAKSQAGGNEQRSEGEKKDGTDGSKRDDSQEYLDDEKPKGCCGRFCSKLCMPCRRCQCCSCCRKQKTGSAKSDERIIVEEVNEKRGCFGRCCRKKKNAGTAEPQMGQKRMAPIQEERESETSKTAKKQNKCCLCLGKVFCCRKTNKVETITGDAEEVRRCCFCIPCGKKKKPTNAWPERRESIISDPPPQPGCCTRLCTKIFCCCRKPKPVSESRRTSMNSKKQSIAPTIPLEDSRPKLHNDLVEYNSKMKGAIPVMPLWLAWFCMICNCIIPGFGTILSGFFCLCVGIPRFSQYDSAKARIGSLIINCIVGIAQAFCVLFCFVGWGWSIWWGLIMLKTARKLRKIRRVEELEMQEEQRQQAAEKARIERDIEAQKKEEKK